MRFVTLSVILLLIAQPLVSAETITLKTGKVVEGEVVEKTGAYVKLDNGETVFKIPFKMMDAESGARLKGYPTIVKKPEVVEIEEASLLNENRNQSHEKKDELNVEARLLEFGERVTGTINGTDVTLAASTFHSNGFLSIYEGDGFADPELEISFWGKKPPQEGLVVEVQPSYSSLQPTPIVYCSWRNSKTGKIKTKSVKENYNLRLELLPVENGIIAGWVSFSVPGEDTSVSGGFRAAID